MHYSVLMQSYPQTLLRFAILFRSFYVGDAAGREKDHSDADIKFAEV